MAKLQEITRLDSIPENLDSLPACFDLIVPTRKILAVTKKKLQKELKDHRELAQTLVSSYGYSVTEFAEDGKKPFWRFQKSNVTIGYSES